MKKRISPYTRLLTEIKEYCYRVRFRKEKLMWIYSKKQLQDGWSLSDLYERAAAANQLGYDVVLSADRDGLRVKYVEKVPEVPYEFRC